MKLFFKNKRKIKEFIIKQTHIVTNLNADHNSNFPAHCPRIKQSNHVLFLPSRVWEVSLASRGWSDAYTCLAALCNSILAFWTRWILDSHQTDEGHVCLQTTPSVTCDMLVSVDGRTQQLPLGPQPNIMSLSLFGSEVP